MKSIQHALMTSKKLNSSRVLLRINNLVLIEYLSNSLTRKRPISTWNYLCSMDIRKNWFKPMFKSWLKSFKWILFAEKVITKLIRLNSSKRMTNTPTILQRFVMSFKISPMPNNNLKKMRRNFSRRRLLLNVILNWPALLKQGCLIKYLNYILKSQL